MILNKESCQDEHLSREYGRLRQGEDIRSTEIASY